MKLNLVEKITKSQLRTDVPDFKSGDTVKVNVRIKEGQKTFTVRKISNGVGVQRTFPVHSPIIEKIEVVRYGKVRRAKLGYLKGLSAKNARIKEDRRK